MGESEPELRISLCFTQRSFHYITLTGHAEVEPLWSLTIFDLHDSIFLWFNLMCEDDSTSFLPVKRQNSLSIEQGMTNLG